MSPFLLFIDMSLTVAKSNPLVGGRSAVVAGRGKGAQGSAEVTNMDFLLR